MKPGLVDLLIAAAAALLFFTQGVAAAAAEAPRQDVPAAAHRAS